MNAYQVYRQTQAQTAAPGELVVMLYRGAVRFVTTAVTAIEAKDNQTAHSNLLSAQATISELLQTLDLECGGDIARRLTSISEFLLNRLVEANVRKDAEPAREVERFLRDLLPAWEEVARQASPARAATLAVAAA
jgi:flagellar protein FliS